MPPKGKKSLKKNKPRSKRTYTRKKGNIIPSAPRNSTMVKLNYTENIVLQVVALVPQTSYVFRINDLYDPNYTGTGHQSYFRDQMFTIYQYGRCVWASIKLTLLSDSAQTPILAVLSPVQNTTGVPDTDITTACERKGSKECYLNGQMVKTLKASSSCDYFFGQKKGATMNDTAFLQTAGASINLANAMFYEILFRSLIAQTQNLYIKVEIQQIVRFEQPLQQFGS